MDLKEFLTMAKDSERFIAIYGTKDSLVSTAKARVLLETTSKKRFNKKVLYYGLDITGNYVVVINEMR